MLSPDEVTFMMRQQIKEGLERTIAYFRDYTPEIQALRGVTQEPWHSLDVYEHTLEVVRAVPDRVPLKLAALLHDIGKPATKTVDAQGRTHFYGHETVGAEIAEDILKRYGLEAYIPAVCTMVRLHMRVHTYTEQWSTKALRRLKQAAGETWDDLITLAHADLESDIVQELELQRKRFTELEQRAALLREKNTVA